MAIFITETVKLSSAIFSLFLSFSSSGGRISRYTSNRPPITGRTCLLIQRRAFAFNVGRNDIPRFPSIRGMNQSSDIRQAAFAINVAYRNAVYTLAITRVSTRQHCESVRVLTFVGVSQRMIPFGESPAPDHHFRTTRALRITRARFSRRFAGLSSSLTCRKIESRPNFVWISRRHTRLGALAPIVRPRRHRRGWSERVPGASRIGRSFRSHADRVRARSLSLSLSLWFFPFYLFLLGISISPLAVGESSCSRLRSFE